MSGKITKNELNINLKNEIESKANQESVNAHLADNAKHVTKDLTLQTGLNAERVGDIPITRIIHGDNSTRTSATTNIDTIGKSGYYLSPAMTTIDGRSDWWLINHIENPHAEAYSLQIASALQVPDLQYTRVQVSGVWSPWRKIWHSGNLGIACKVFHTANVSIPNNSITTLPFNTEVFDDMDMHNIDTNNSRLVAPVAGVYLIGGVVKWAANSTGKRTIGIAPNGGSMITSVSQATVASPELTEMHCQIIERLNVGSYVELQVAQNSGGALNVQASNTSPYFYMVKVG